MTKKDYALLAEGLFKAKPDREDNLLFDQWSYTVSVLADKLEAGNPRFDRDIFVAACLK